MNWVVILGMLGLAIAAQSFDVWTTNRNLSGTGGVEYNPIVKWSLTHFGSVWAVKLLFVIMALVALMVSERALMIALEMFTAFGLAAGWLNVRHWNV